MGKRIAPADPGKAAASLAGDQAVVLSEGVQTWQKLPALPAGTNVWPMKQPSAHAPAWQICALPQAVPSATLAQVVPEAQAWQRLFGLAAPVG